MKSEDIKKVAVIGAGIMGEGIALNFAQAGISVWLLDKDQGILDNTIARIELNLKQLEEFGLVRDDLSAIVSRIQPALHTDLKQIISNCEFAVEAIPEVLELKKELFYHMDSFGSDAILSSNTSSFTISSISEGLRNPQRVVGLHYFNPAHIIPAVEIHQGRDTSSHTVDITRKLMLRVGKKPVLVRKEVPGFIINRLTGAMEREIDFLLEEGIVTPDDLDTAVKASYGFRLACIGPMKAEDMIGLDTAARVSEHIFKQLSNSKSPSPLLLEKVRKGELGIKSGKGWYDYTGRTRDEVGDEINKRLLRQLVLFKACEDETA